MKEQLPPDPHPRSKIRKIIETTGGIILFLLILYLVMRFFTSTNARWVFFNHFMDWATCYWTD